MRARYSIAKETATSLTIRDESRRFGTMTVTNDAEAVVEHLADQRLIDGRRLFYYDSEDQLDELVHENGRFVRFERGPRP